MLQTGCTTTPEVTNDPLVGIQTWQRLEPLPRPSIMCRSSLADHEPIPLATQNQH
jgi:hypothetical protein